MVPAATAKSQETGAHAADGSEVAGDPGSVTLVLMTLASVTEWRLPRWLGALRPGFMSITVAGALLVSPSFGYLAERYADPELVAEGVEQHAEAMVRRDLARLGWKPLGDPRVYDDVTRLERTQSVELLHATRPFRLALYHGPVTGDPAPAANRDSATRVLADELSRYPRHALREARFRRILLCQNLAEGPTPIPSLPNYQQTLLLDVDASPEFLRRLLHHELFHFVDYADDDQVQTDPAWSRINGRFFVYGSGGRAMREPGSSRLTDTQPGFLSPYSMSALEEDKAEIFSFLMTQPTAVRRIAERDAVVARKVTAIRQQVSAQLPGLSDRFWSEIENGKR
jgi:hypothetical protein